MMTETYVCIKCGTIVENEQHYADGADYEYMCIGCYYDRE